MRRTKMRPECDHQRRGCVSDTAKNMNPDVKIIVSVAAKNMNPDVKIIVSVAAKNMNPDVKIIVILVRNFSE